MSVILPNSILESLDKDVLVDAIYFVVRQLRNVNRGYPKALTSSEPAPGARILAERAVAEIETCEQRSVSDLDEDRVNEYIRALEEELRSRYAGAVGGDMERAARILEQMRNSEQG